MTLRTVFFDFGDTLAALTVPVSRIWYQLLRERGIDSEVEGVERALRETDAALLPTVYDYTERMGDFWALYDRAVFERLGITDPGGVLAGAIDQRFEDPTSFLVFPETRDVLSSLRSRNLDLGIISNSTSDLLGTLGRLDLAQYFHHVTYSQEVRAEKPDPPVFRLALSRAGCTPSEAVHIGNSFEKDVVGARGAGIAPILLDRANRSPTADCPRIRTLRELPPLLRNF